MNSFNSSEIRYSSYYLDHEPSEYGVYAGRYAPNKIAYVGLASSLIGYATGRIQTHPPGFFYLDFLNAGAPKFTNDSSQIYYIVDRSFQKFEWVNSSNGQAEPFIVDYGTPTTGFPQYFGRIKKNGYYSHGSVVAASSALIYLINDQTYARSKTYQVLTCRSSRENSTATVLPNPADSSPIPIDQLFPMTDTGCSKLMG
jgi:hypothetical protein